LLAWAWGVEAGRSATIAGVNDGTFLTSDFMVVTKVGYVVRKQAQALTSIVRGADIDVFRKSRHRESGQTDFLYRNLL
jgi:hypothetical protein